MEILVSRLLRVDFQGSRVASDAGLIITADALARAGAARPTPAVGSDRISYSISYDGRTIQWAEGARPPELDPALAILQELLP